MRITIAVHYGRPVGRLYVNDDFRAVWSAVHDTIDDAQRTLLDHAVPPENRRYIERWIQGWRVVRLPRRFSRGKAKRWRLESIRATVACGLPLAAAG